MKARAAARRLPILNGFKELCSVFGVLAACSLCQGLTQEAPVSSRGFDASGVVISRRLYGDNEIVWTNTFTVSMNDCRYVISIPQPREYDGLILEECLFDGTDTYLTHTFDTGLRPSHLVEARGGRLVEVPAPDQIVQRNEYSVTIANGAKPPTPFDSLVLVWLGLAAHCHYGATHETNEPSLFFLGPAYLLHKLTLTTLCHTDDSKQDFLRERLELHDGYSYNVHTHAGGGFVSPLQTPPRLMKKRLPHPLSQGYTNSVYRVLEWTNAGEVVFPAHFQIHRYFPLPIDGIQTSFKADGFVTGISAVQPRSYTPKILPRTRIKEARASVTGLNASFTYFSDDGRVLTRADLLARDDFRSFRTSGYVARGSPTAKIVGLVAFACLLSIPLIIFAYRAARARRSSNST